MVGGARLETLFLFESAQINLFVLLWSLNVIVFKRALPLALFLGTVCHILAELCDEIILSLLIVLHVLTERLLIELNWLMILVKILLIWLVKIGIGLLGLLWLSERLIWLVKIGIWL